MSHGADGSGDAPTCNTRLPFFESRTRFVHRIDAFCGAFFLRAWCTNGHGVVTPLRERQRQKRRLNQKTDPFLLTAKSDAVKFHLAKELRLTGETVLTDSAHNS